MKLLLLLLNVFNLSSCKDKNDSDDDPSNDDPSTDQHVPLSPGSVQPDTLSKAPLLGTNFTHHGPELEGFGILQTYHKIEVWQKVQQDLLTMWSGGARTLRLLIWHYELETPQDWGVIPHNIGGGTVET